MTPPDNSLHLSQFILAYFSGLGTVLTPCIYPLIPVTLSLFGVTANLSRIKAFLLSASYVAGICLTYTVLGLFSGKTGALFGSFLGNPIVVSVLVIFFLALVLMSLEIVNFSFIGKLQNTASKVGGTGYGGAFLMGTVSGFVAAPCAGPILIGILAIAASSQSTFLGALLLFTYALGFGTVFLFLGTFSNLTKKLPRAGNWMGVVKFLSAAALFAVILFVIRPFFPSIFEYLSKNYNFSLLIAVAIAGAAIAWQAYRSMNKSLKLLAVITFTIPVFQILILGPAKTHPTWLSSLDDVLATAKAEKKIAMVDIFAQWCGACKELDEKTFSDSRVQQKLATIVTGRLDFSMIDDKKQALLDKYEIPGLPCLLFLDSEGIEIPNARVTEFEPPEQFLKDLELATSERKAAK